MTDIGTTTPLSGGIRACAYYSLIGGWIKLETAFTILKCRQSITQRLTLSALDVEKKRDK